MTARRTASLVLRSSTLFVLILAAAACGPGTVVDNPPAGAEGPKDEDPGDASPGVVTITPGSFGGGSPANYGGEETDLCAGDEDCATFETCASDGICIDPTVVRAPQFSVERGHYTEAFTVAITSETPGATIRFTTGSLWPSESAGTVGDSAAVATTTVLRAIATKEGLEPSKITTHTYIFVEDVLRQPANAQGTPDETGVLGWGSTEMTKSVVDRYTDRVRGALTSAPVLSISGDPGGLFGDGLRSGVMSNTWGTKEEEVSLELIFPDGSHDFLGHAGVHVSGSGGSLADKKPLALEFRGMYGQKKLHYPLMPGSHVRAFDEIRLRSFWATEGRPYYMQWADDLQRAMSGEAHHGFFVHLYINGIYWGLYNPSEVANEGFGEAHLGGDEDDWSRVRGNVALAAELLPMIGDLSDPVQYAAFKEVLNVEHYADLLILMMWLVDLNNRTLGAEVRAIHNPAEGIGYHVYMWDPEEARTKGENLDLNPLPYALGENPLLQQLLESADFRITFADRIRKHLLDDGTLMTGAADGSLRSRVDEVEEAYPAEVARWSMTDSYELRGLGLSIGGLRGDVSLFQSTWIPQRANTLMGFLREAGLYPDVEAPRFSQKGGVVSAGFRLAVSGSGGTLHYTTDGTDPRVTGSGAVHASARTGALPLSLTINQTTHVRARLKSGEDWSAMTEAVFTTGRPYSNLRITELMYHPPDVDAVDGDLYEFLELKNTGSAPIDLTGAYFSRGLTFRFHGTTILPPGELLVLAKNRDRFAREHPGIQVSGVYAGSLSNGGEHIELTAADGTTILSMRYDDTAPWPSAPDGTGYSLVPTDPNPTGDPNEPAQWRASTHPTGSPGTDD